jgi:hypothetical protein
VNATRIKGFCPACGQDELYVSHLRCRLGCSNPVCPDPDAADKLLADNETHHIVRFDPNDEVFDIKHPIRERIDDELFDCSIHQLVLDAEDYHDWEGTWRILEEADPPGWEKIA